MILKLNFLNIEHYLNVKKKYLFTRIHNSSIGGIINCMQIICIFLLYFIHTYKNWVMDINWRLFQF